MSNLTEEEKELTVSFRGRVQDIIGDDEYLNQDIFLIRWIRARGNNLENAESMIRKSFKWRLENNIDSILQEPPDPYFSNGFSYTLNGIDRKGQPVLCMAIGDWDPRKVVQDGKVEEFRKYVNRMYERLAEAIKTCDANRKRDQSSAIKDPIYQFTLIMNYQDFSILQMANMQAVHSMLQFALIYEAHYPEILDKAFFINTNPVFQAFFAIMRPLLAARTLNKIKCFGSNRLEWEPAIREVVDENQIARQFGG